ncbi:hypothetical protein [Virgibacillus doumboii]|uniref:hypothetical protein n=1 Tax=Virgibacillus doumboii TaxID=2697503 RepID=UPI0013E0393D|nr:hypothetical protein [Virgibacillus doumboii]
MIYLLIYLAVGLIVCVLPDEPAGIQKDKRIEVLFMMFLATVALFWPAYLIYKMGRKRKWL